MRRYKSNCIVVTSLAMVLTSSLLVGNVLADTFSSLGASGGGGGNFFSDLQKGKGRQLTEVRIRSGAVINSIQTVYVNTIGQEFVSSTHGGDGGTLQIFKLASGERITRISGRHGKFIDSLLIETNTGRAKGCGGGGGPTPYTYTAPPGSGIHGFFGRSGKFLDAIGVILRTP